MWWLWVIVFPAGVAILVMSMMVVCNGKRGSRLWPPKSQGGIGMEYHEKNKHLFKRREDTRQTVLIPDLIVALIALAGLIFCIWNYIKDFPGRY